MSALIETLRDIVGDSHCLVAAADTAPYLTDWRGRYRGRACCVVRPGNAAEVAAVGRLRALLVQQLHGVVVVQPGEGGLDRLELRQVALERLQLQPARLERGPGSSLQLKTLRVDQLRRERRGRPHRAAPHHPEMDAP